MTAWTDLVKKVYNENKGKAGYKLGDAMKEAKLQYKKEPIALSAKPVSAPKSIKKRRGKARKSRKSKK